MYYYRDRDMQYAGAFMSRENDIMNHCRNIDELFCL